MDHEDEIISLLKEMNETMKEVVFEMQELKNLFVKYDLELQDFDEEIREG